MVGKEVEENVIRVVHGDRRRERSRRVLEVTGASWIDGPPSADRLQVRLRHGPGSTGCLLEPLGPDRWRLTLDEADPGVAPGQHAVLYDGEVCLGGAVIR